MNIVEQDSPGRPPTTSTRCKIDSENLPAGKFPSEVYDELGSRLPEGRRKELMALSNCRSPEECPSAVEGIVRTNALQLELDPKGKMMREEREAYSGVYPLLN